MKVLIALPVEHKTYRSIDDIIKGHAPVNGTDGSFIRLAGLLTEAGIEVCLSTASPVSACQFRSINHRDVKAEEFDHLIVHQEHWNGTSLTFGNHVLAKTYLWLHLEVNKGLVYTFLQNGGHRVICPSQYLAKWYRMLPKWQNKVVVIPNLHCPIFRPILASESEESTLRLLFIGALGLGKGLIELTQIWSYLAQRQVALEFAIAGSISLYQDDLAGEAGLAEPTLENTVILPWLKSLPKDYQPKFLGSLSPKQLQIEIAKSWAVIVNPSPVHPETFCISAVEAEACDRTVFSVRAGALPETVYHDKFNSLGEGDAVESVCERIIEGLSHPEQVAENGKLAGNYVRRRFDNQVISTMWIAMLNGQPINSGLPKFGDSFQGVVRDVIRWSRMWKVINGYKDAEYQIMTALRRVKGSA
ncbi:glycosyltransferase family 4 protein [Phormidesmis priestleyi]|uniref:glycosyltransferase family 4 protein n=1 Tax=Phormidesmis priestleyi TaxID=268141 RepID=UPI00083B892A|nr:glycosyltransferase family 4 protein [Phormidesmis priestleyi]